MNTFAFPLPHDPFVPAEVSTGYVAIKPANASQPVPQMSYGAVNFITDFGDGKGIHVQTCRGELP